MTVRGVQVANLAEELDVHFGTLAKHLARCDGLLKSMAAEELLVTHARGDKLKGRPAAEVLMKPKELREHMNSRLTSPDLKTAEDALSVMRAEAAQHALDPHN